MKPFSPPPLGRTSRWIGAALIAGAIVVLMSEASSASLCQSAAQPIKPNVPIATSTGIEELPQEQYAERMRTFGHLPTMTREYVFGRKIPYPATDRLGHVRVEASRPELTPAPAHTSAVNTARPTIVKSESKPRSSQAKAHVKRKPGRAGAEPQATDPN